jgi:hypothetical protein
MRNRLGLFLATVSAACVALAADFVAPNANLKVDGIPPIPTELAAKLDRYAEFKPAAAVDWHPEKHELIIARRAGNTTQLHLVSARCIVFGVARNGPWRPRARERGQSHPTD